MKYSILVICLLVLVSCKDTKKQEEITKEDTISQTVEATKDHYFEDEPSIYDNSWTNEIALNDGTKWDANSETNEGVLKMQDHLKNQATTTLDDFHLLAETLNQDKNFVVKNCTMKGASHDNLHVWLLPLMAKIDALSETTTVGDAEKVKQSIEENVNAYFNYFQ